MFLTAGKFEQIMATLKSEDRSARERRQAPRVGLRMQARILVQSKDAAVHSKLVWLRDVSIEGIGFMLPAPVRLGTLVMVCLPRGNSGSLKLLYRIVRCNSVDKEQYVIGAKLDRVLEDTVTTPSGANASEAPPAAA